MASTFPPGISVRQTKPTRGPAAMRPNGSKLDGKRTHRTPALRNLSTTIFINHSLFRSQALWLPAPCEKADVEKADCRLAPAISPSGNNRQNEHEGGPRGWLRNGNH